MLKKFKYKKNKMILNLNSEVINAFKYCIINLK